MGTLKNVYRFIYPFDDLLLKGCYYILLLTICFFCSLSNFSIQIYYVAVFCTFVCKMIESLLNTDKASEKKRNICTFKETMCFIYIYIYILYIIYYIYIICYIYYIYIYIYMYIYIYIYIQLILNSVHLLFTIVVELSLCVVLRRYFIK